MSHGSTLVHHGIGNTGLLVSKDVAPQEFLSSETGTAGQEGSQNAEQTNKRCIKCVESAVCSLHHTHAAQIISLRQDSHLHNM